MMVEPIIAQPLFATTEHPTSPRQFQIVEISARLACELNRRWHSTLPQIHWANVVRTGKYICFALFFGGKYYGVGIWSNPVARYFNHKKFLELRRMALCDLCPRNTASYFLSQMIKQIRTKFPDIRKLITYSIITEHGTIYRASGWKVASNKVKFTPWNLTRKRSPPQTTHDKIRWEFEL